MEEGSGVAVAADSATDQRQRSRRGTAAAFVPLHAGREGISGGRNRAALGSDARRYIVGRFAQRRGAEVSSRLVSSAKSWLSYSAMDRSAAMLPWKAGRRRHAHFSRRCLGRIPAPSPHGLGSRTSRRAVRGSGSPGHHPRVIRCRRARTHRESRDCRRLPQRHHARRTAGRLLRVDRTA